MSIRIRKTRAEDIETVYAIELEQFSHPWKKKFFLSELSHDISFFHVAEEADSGEMAGYIIFWIVEETLELHDIAVKGTFKKKGIGSLLMQFMFDTAAARGVEEMFLEVRKSNHEAISFYEKFDFKLVGERKNYYSDPQEDALIYKLMI
jgi:ribosomal-protein-alanine N-acetyltransferase